MDAYLANKLLRFSRNGRVGKAWKQLWSPGLAAGTHETVQKMEPQLGSVIPTGTPGLTTNRQVYAYSASASSSFAPQKGHVIVPPPLSQRWQGPQPDVYLPGHMSDLPSQHGQTVRSCLYDCPSSFILARFKDGTASDVLGWH
eukprot:76802-Amphidinium_carterae.1